VLEISFAGVVAFGSKSPLSVDATGDLEARGDVERFGLLGDNVLASVNWVAEVDWSLPA
jgi:hypothetical protein